MIILHLKIFQSAMSRIWTIFIEIKEGSRFLVDFSSIITVTRERIVSIRMQRITKKPKNSRQKYVKILKKETANMGSTVILLMALLNSDALDKKKLLLILNIVVITKLLDDKVEFGNREDRKGVEKIES